MRRRGIRVVISTRHDQWSNPRFDRATYWRRNVVERLIGWLEENRRLAAHYAKPAVNFLGASSP